MRRSEADDDCDFKVKEKLPQKNRGVKEKFEFWEKIKEREWGEREIRGDNLGQDMIIRGLL